MNFVWHRRGITPESLSCQSCVAWQSLSKLIAELNLIKKFDSDDVLLSNLIPKLSLAWQKQCLNWASLLPGWCQRGFDWGDGWIQAKLGCKKKSVNRLMMTSFEWSKYKSFTNHVLLVRNSSYQSFFSELDNM